MAINFTFTAPGVDPLVLGHGTNLRIDSFDLGFATPRPVVEQAVDADGTVNTTAHSGDRSIAVTVHLPPEATWADVQRLRRYLDPALQSEMVVSGIGRGAPDLSAVVKGGSGSWVHDRRELVGSIAVHPCQWVCPSGLLESAVLRQETIIPGAGAVDGVEFDGVEFDGVEFPLVDPPGTVDIVNAGNRNAFPVIRMFGPFGAEGTGSDETELINVTTGRKLVFAGTGISAGDYLEVDFRAKTILVNSLTSQSRYSRLKFPDSAWWTLAPGTNTIAFRPDTFSGNAQALVLWRDAYA